MTMSNLKNSMTKEMKFAKREICLLTP